MNAMSALAWLFPVIFMVHDFEEIVLVGAWRKRNERRLSEALGKRGPYTAFVSTASFSFAVEIEFVLFAGIALISCLTGNYLVWFAFFAGFTLHLLVHIGMTARFGGYVPGLATAIPFLPLSVWIFFRAASLTGYGAITLAAATLVGLAAMPALIFGLHKCMAAFGRRINLYARGGRPGEN
jgi:hypothetical protein